jgi:hypothetical protein
LWVITLCASAPLRLCARWIVSLDGVGYAGSGDPRTTAWHGLPVRAYFSGRTEIGPTFPHGQGARAMRGVLSRRISFFISRGPKLGEFQPTSRVQVVGWSHVSERQWADTRWVSARGWAVIRPGCGIVGTKRAVKCRSFIDQVTHGQNCSPGF